MNITALRLITRILALLITIWFLFWYTVFGIGSVVTDLHGRVTTAIIPEIIFGIVILTAYAFSWRREDIGGILFIIASFGVTVAGFINGLQHPVSGWSLLLYIQIFVNGWTHLGFPLLLVGVLFLVVWRTSRAEQAQAKG
jgi:hypothetical protein